MCQLQLNRALSCKHFWNSGGNRICVSDKLRHPLRLVAIGVLVYACYSVNRKLTFFHVHYRLKNNGSPELQKNYFCSSAQLPIRDFRMAFAIRYGVANRAGIDMAMKIL